MAHNFVAMCLATATVAFEGMRQSFSLIRRKATRYPIRGIAHADDRGAKAQQRQLPPPPLCQEGGPLQPNLIYRRSIRKKAEELKEKIRKIEKKLTRR